MRWSTLTKKPDKFTDYGSQFSYQNYVHREATMRKRLFFLLAASFFITACADNSEPGERLDFDPDYSNLIGALEPGDPGSACDEDGATTVCYTGPAGTQDVGACKAGTQACVAGKRTECLGQTLPSDEVCDGADNDCDAVADEDLGQTSCGVGECTSTVDNCSGGLATDCELVALLKISPEVCDGKDNDCDASIDDDQSGAPLSFACYTGAAGTQDVGLCKGGTKTCTGGELSDCVGEVTPATDVCDTLDNDCDASADEDFPNVGQACTVGQGECEASDVFVCNVAQNGEVCNATPGTPEAETCDTKDNDCDGLVDEGDDGNALTQACYNGADGTQDVGECKGGTQTCTAGAFGDCDGEVVPGAETCDGKDNDCDATSDEGDDGKALTVGCYTGADGTSGVGACGDGVQVCAAGELTSCFDETVPLTEVCFDLVDNDCDGSVDEDCTVPCTDADNDGYGEGCAKGADCDDSNAAINPAEPEWCGNAKDDNCNGLTDELVCYPTAAGSVLVRFESTGACPFDNLIMVNDFASISSPAIPSFDGETGFTTNLVVQASSGGTNGLHRFNFEFDTDDTLGNELSFVTSDVTGVVVHDECGKLRFFFEGTEVAYQTFLDPRPVPDPFMAANAFTCFGDAANCFLCGGDWDANGTADCDEDGGFCDTNVQDNAACGG